MGKKRCLLGIAGILGAFLWMSQGPGNLPVQAAGTVISQDTVLENNVEEEYAGVYEYEDLTLSPGVHVTSSGISHLVIKVKGTLTVGEGAEIRVRNGYYPEAPSYPVSMYNRATVKTSGVKKDGYRLYPNTYGQGGDGGAGGRGSEGYSSKVHGHGGDGGAGGYGGGAGGAGGSSPTSSKSGYSGRDNGGNGGARSALEGFGGGATDVGKDGANGKHAGNAGGGGGGNGGYGGSGGSNAYGVGRGGAGGGGGGYGGGVLTIIADRIVIQSTKPCFLVSGQQGGYTGRTGNAGENGKPGEGGMLLIESNSYSYQESHWNIEIPNIYPYDVERPSYGGGHGLLIGGPQKVFINGGEYGVDDIPASMGGKPVQGITIRKKLTLYVGSSASLNATVLPSDAENKSYRLTSSKPSVVSVEGTKVTGRKAGKAKITATASEGGFQAVCTVTVKKRTQKKEKLSRPVLTLKRKGARAVTLSWKKVKKAQGYEIYQKIGSKSFKRVKTLKKTSYTLTKRKKGKKYTYKVRAYRKSGGVKTVSKFSKAKTFQVRKVKKTV